MIVNSDDKVIVHGLTGKQGTFWAGLMSEYGTNIVGGVNPKKAGTIHEGMPVFASAVDAATHVGVDVSVMFVPPAGARAAVIDAVDAGARLVVVLTEFIPVHDTMELVHHARRHGSQIIGPNTAGVVTPGEAFVGFMPAFDDRIFREGSVGVVSRSGSLGTLACLELTRNGLGQSAFLGVGGDPVSGTSTADAVSALAAHPSTEAIVVIGEIGGSKEEEAASVIATIEQPVVSFIAGKSSPPGKRMGHAGAIIEGNTGTYASKRDALEAAGATVVDVPGDIAAAVRG